MGARRGWVSRAVPVGAYLPPHAARHLDSRKIRLPDPHGPRPSRKSSSFPQEVQVLEPQRQQEGRQACPQKGLQLALPQDPRAPFSIGSFGPGQPAQAEESFQCCHPLEKVKTTYSEDSVKSWVQRAYLNHLTFHSLSYTPSWTETLLISFCPSSASLGC